MNTFFLLLLPLALATIRDSASVSSLDVVTEDTELSSESSTVIDHRLSRLVLATNDFYNSVALMPDNDGFQPLTLTDMVDISRWIHSHLSPSVSDNYIATIINLTNEIAFRNISFRSDWRVLSMISSHLSIIPSIHSTYSLFHISNQLQIVWRRIAQKRPLEFINAAMSVLSFGHSKSIEFVIAFFRCIDGQTVPVEKLQDIHAIGNSMNQILYLTGIRFDDPELTTFFANIVESDIDMATISLMGRWDAGGSETTVDYFVDTVYDSVTRMKNRLDQIEHALDVLWTMEFFLEEKFGHIPQAIIGGSSRKTVRSRMFLDYVFRKMNESQLERYLVLTSDILLGLDGSLSTWLTLNGVLELGLVNGPGELEHVINSALKHPSSQVKKLDTNLSSPWFTGDKSVWGWDIVGTILNGSILIRLIGSGSNPDLIGLVKKISAAIRLPHMNRSAITMDLIIPCKEKINRILEELRSL